MSAWHDSTDSDGTGCWIAALAFLALAICVPVGFVVWKVLA